MKTDDYDDDDKSNCYFISMRMQAYFTVDLQPHFDLNCKVLLTT